MTATEPSTRLTISLPVSLVEALDRFLAKGTSRSAAVRDAIEQAVQGARRRDEIDQFVRGYADLPQTEEEFGWADAVVLDLFAEQSSE